MNLHEYQAKSLFKDYGLPVSDGYAVDTADEAVEAATKIGGDRWVVKVQVHAGGRGKAGGVKLADSLDEVRAFADNWIGKNLVTFQTDEHGQPVSKIYVESCTDIDTELYLGAVVDRGSRRVVFMASTEGGVEIEKVKLFDQLSQEDQEEFLHRLQLSSFPQVSQKCVFSSSKLAPSPPFYSPGHHFTPRRILLLLPL